MTDAMKALDRLYSLAIVGMTTGERVKAYKDVKTIRAELERVGKYELTLNKLARLGNGDRLGNSDGNLIAQEALGIGIYAKNAKEKLEAALTMAGNILHDNGIDTDFIEEALKDER